jgi:excisionase family DNA binding protein
MSTDPYAPSPSSQKTAPERPARSTSRLVAAKSAARAIGLPYTTLRDLAFRGEIPVVKAGRAWYFEWRDLDSWIASHRERLDA